MMFYLYVDANDYRDVTTHGLGGEMYPKPVLAHRPQMNLSPFGIRGYIC